MRVPNSYMPQMPRTALSRRSISGRPRGSSHPSRNQASARALLGLVSGLHPLPASGDREMAELGQNHGEVAGIGQLAGTTRAPVGPVQPSGAVDVVVAELDHLLQRKE